MSFDNYMELTPDDINMLPALSYKGEIRLIDTEMDIDEAVTNIKDAKTVGFDTESRPSFIKGRVYPISLIQIALDDIVYIIRIKHTGLTNSLLSFLESDIEKVGVGLYDDIKKLSDLKTFLPNNFIDLSDIARKKGYVKTNLRVLCARYLSRRIVKSSQKTNWAKVNLTEAQLRYAATDAWVCLKLRNLIENDKGISVSDPD